MLGPKIDYSFILKDSGCCGPRGMVALPALFLGNWTVVTGWIGAHFLTSHPNPKCPGVGVGVSSRSDGNKISHQGMCWKGASTAKQEEGKVIKPNQTIKQEAN